MDLIVRGGYLITMDSERKIIKDGAIKIEKDKIVDVGKYKDIKSKYSAELILGSEKHIVMPGLIDCHVHLAQAMLRGFADNVTLISWLKDFVWPLQGSYEGRDGEVSAKLCMLEMIRTGTTCFLESMLHSRYGLDAIAKSLEECGLRGILSKTVMDMPGYAMEQGIMHKGMLETKEESLNAALEMIDKWNGKANGRIKVWFGPRTPGACTPELYRTISKLAKEKRVGITIHLAEVREDVKFIKEEYGKLPAEFAKDVGLLGRNVVLAHGVWFSDEEIRLLAETGTSVCHCPASNMKLGSGIARVIEMRRQGVNVALGCDGGPSNNTYDMFREMRLAVLLQRVRLLSTTEFSAEDVLEMATICGAKALGMENEIGSLEPGKKADVILIDTKFPGLTPNVNPVSNIVYVASGHNVDTVIVDGRILMINKKVLTLDEEEILREASERIIEVMKRANVKSEFKWKLV